MTRPAAGGAGARQQTGVPTAAGERVGGDEGRGEAGDGDGGGSGDGDGGGGCGGGGDGEGDGGGDGEGDGGGDGGVVVILRYISVKLKLR